MLGIFFNFTSKATERGTVCIKAGSVASKVVMACTQPVKTNGNFTGWMAQPRRGAYCIAMDNLKWRNYFNVRQDCRLISTFDYIHFLSFEIQSLNTKFKVWIPNLTVWPLWITWEQNQSHRKEVLFMTLTMAFYIHMAGQLPTEPLSRPRSSTAQAPISV
jgi:hypothetical protein